MGHVPASGEYAGTVATAIPSSLAVLRSTYVFAIKVSICRRYCATGETNVVESRTAERGHHQFSSDGHYDKTHRIAMYLIPRECRTLKVSAEASSLTNRHTAW